MYFESEDNLTKDVVKDVVDMLCGVVSGDSLGINTVIGTFGYEDAKEPICSSSKDLSSGNEVDDRNWTARHYRMGIAIFLEQVKKDSRLETSRKRNVNELSGKEGGNISSSNIMSRKTDDDQEIPRKATRPQYSNFKEVFRERELFVTKSVDFGFSISHSCNNYIKSCKWSSSGSYLATTSQDRIARIFHFDSASFKMGLKSSMNMGDLIYDSCWHPTSDWLATTSKDHPIHVWDSDGRWLTTFRGINNFDELDNAYSLCFASDSCLYAGYKSNIRKFDMNRPGRQVSELITWNKESKGQRGIISCIAVSPILPTNYAAGSYGKTVGFYSDYSPSVECMFECPLAVTLLRYTPDGNFLLTVGRKDDDIICWDLRHPGKIYSLYSRPSKTNQRIYFDIDSSGTYLFSGSSNGELYIFDLKCTSGDEPLAPCAQLSAHNSALCGVSIHRECPLVATCSGQRIFPFPELDQMDDIDSGITYEDINSAELLDNSLALWSFDQ